MKSLLAVFLALALSPLAAADDWPQWMGPNRDAVWAETGIVDRLPADGPKVLWRVPIGGGYSGPAVVGDQVYVLDYVKTAGDAKENPLGRADLKGQERVLCFDASSGKVVWKHEYDCPYKISYPAGPRCTPTVHAGKVYALGAMGNLICLDAAKGTVLWSKDFPKDFGVKAPLWGFCGHPFVDGERLICIVGGDGTTAMAFDKDTGKEVWRALSSKETGYCAPTIIEAGGARQLIIWHGEALNSLDPKTGKLHWTFPFVTHTGMAIMLPRKDSDYLFAGSVFGNTVCLKLAADQPAAAEAWRGPKDMKGSALFPTNMTPFVEDGVLYGVDQPGQFRAVKIATGERLWESWLPLTGEAESRPVYTGTVFVVKNGARFFMFNERGELIIAKMSPEKYEEVSRWKMLEPSSVAFGRDVVWSHPALDRESVV